MQSFVVCPGPNAAGRYHRVWELARPGAQIIACNKAILALPRLRDFTRYRYNLLWLVADQLCTEQPWWIEASERAADDGYCPVFSHEVCDRLPGVHVTSFAQGSSLSAIDYELDPRTLRSNATVAGAAIQLAVHSGANEIHLFGVDMHGNRYFDGSRFALEREDWPHRRTLQALIDHVRQSIPVVIQTPSLLV